MRRLGVLLVAATLASGIVTVSGGSTASADQDTFTVITTPKGTELLHYDARPGSTRNHFTVTGKTSADVTSVDIVCLLRGVDGALNVQVWASSVSVSEGAFSTIATVTNVSGQCRLVALPTGVDPDTDYLGAYRGPLVYSYGAGSFLDGDKVPYSAIMIDTAGDGVAAYEEEGGCDGVVLIATVALPRAEALGLAQPECLAGRPDGNIGVNDHSTASSISVDGHSAYTPQMVHSELIADDSLAVTQSRLTVTAGRRAANGDLSMAESGPLMRCGNDTPYPPTPASCPKLLSTGVTLRVVISMVHDSHEVSFRQSYVSSDGKAHHVAVVVENAVASPDDGATGYTFPGRSSTFQPARSAESVTGLGHKAGTVLVRSDLDSFEGSSQADTQGLTYSRAPSKIQFVKSSGGLRPNVSFLPFTVQVPAHGAGYLGLAVTENNLTAPTRALAAAAATAMLSAPSVTSPHGGATVRTHKVTVKGSVALGANGLPTSVTVNDHKAHLTKTASKVSFSASVALPLGKRTLTVVATDSAGNTRTTKVKIHHSA